MTGAVKLSFLCCLLPGISCEYWSLSLPTNVETIGGACAYIPCNISIPPEFEVNLDDTCAFLWRGGSVRGGTVFHSGLQPNQNIMPGALIGSLKDKDCTTVFYNISFNHYMAYYPRLECNNVLKFTFDQRLVISTRNPLPEITVVASKLKVKEGTQMTVSCSTAIPCPLVPPLLTWNPSMVPTEETTDSGTLTSVVKFAASYLHDERNISCTVLYPIPALGSDIVQEKHVTLHVFHAPRVRASAVPSGPVTNGSSVTLICTSIANPPASDFIWFRKVGLEVEEVGSKPTFTFNVKKLSEDSYYCKIRNAYGAAISEEISFNVTFAPEILPSSHCVSMLSQINCSCDSQANPPPSFEWELTGEAANHSANTSIMQVSLDGVTLRSVITLPHVDGDEFSVVCLSFNSVGSDRLVLNVSVSDTQQGIHSHYVLIGSAAGAAVMLVVCASLLIYYCRKRRARSTHKKEPLHNAKRDSATQEESSVTNPPDGKTKGLATGTPDIPNGNVHQG
ncbi:unnamed protein product [Ophioblennius macclurei]